MLFKKRPNSINTLHDLHHLHKLGSISKSVLLFSTCIASLCSSFNATESHRAHDKAPKKIILTSKVLKLVDGITGAMDEYRMRQVMDTGRRIVKLQYGVPDTKRPKKRIGTIEYKGKKYTLLDVIQLEDQYKKRYKLKDPLKHSELKELFDIATTQFRDIVKPYLEEVKKFKPITIKLIEEFCEKAKKPQSYLRHWKNGDNEREMFFKHIRSNRDLSVFCTDLTHFLSCMIESCPKGYKQYLAWKKAHQRPSHKVLSLLHEHRHDHKNKKYNKK